MMLLNYGVGEDSCESFGPQDIQPVNSKGNHSWIFIGRTDAEAETPILWPPHATNWLTGKDPDAGKDWGQEEKGMTEDEMVRWHHRLDGHGFVWTPGVGDGQGGLACCSPCGLKESDMTEWLNWTEINKWILGKMFLCFAVLINIFFLCWNADLSIVAGCSAVNENGKQCLKKLKKRIIKSPSTAPTICPHPSIFKTLFMNVCVCSVARSCPPLCNPMDCSLPGSSVHEIS